VPLYGEILKELAGGEVARRSAELRLGDDVITVLLARLLGAVASRLGVPPTYQAALPYDASLFEGDDGELAALFAALPRGFELAALAALEGARLFVLTLADAIDLDTLRLFGLLGDGATAGALAHVDLLAALSSPEANDIVNFSLEILPSVLETKTRAAAGTTSGLRLFGHRHAGLHRQPRAHRARLGRARARAAHRRSRGPLLRPRTEPRRAAALSPPAGRCLGVDAW
jgi:hypothetical protein